jgi:hypothetical protein
VGSPSQQLAHPHHRLDHIHPNATHHGNWFLFRFSGFFFFFFFFFPLGIANSYFCGNLKELAHMVFPNGVHSSSSQFTVHRHSDSLNDTHGSLMQ